LTESQGLDHETAQRRNAFLDRGCGDQRLGELRGQTPPQFVPEPRIRPRVRILVESALHVVAAAVQRTHAAQGETAFMIRINQLVRDRWSVGQNPKPAKRVNALETAHRLGRDAAPANAVIAIAAGDEVADQFACSAAVRVAHDGMRALEAFDAHVARVEYQLRAGRRARLEEILGDFGLTVDRNGIARQTLQVDAKGASGEAQGKPVVDQPLAQQPLADVRLYQQFDRALLQDAGANARGDILAAAPLEHHAVDAVLMQQLREQEPGWAGADDSYLSAGHDASPMEPLRSLAAARRARCARPGFNR
jgi:hypothetical protein